MLDNIPYSAHSLGSLTTLSENLSNKATSEHPDDAMIAASSAKIDEALVSANKALGSGIGSLLTGALSAADNLRDACYRSLRDHVQAGLSRETNPDYQSACERLWVVFKSNNKLLASLPYDEETAAIKSLLTDLTGMTGDLETIHAATWVQEFKDSNDQFVKLQGDRSTDTASKDVPTDQIAKAALTDALKIFVSTIDSLWGFGQPAGIADTVTQLNQIIKEANTAVR